MQKQFEESALLKEKVSDLEMENDQLREMIKTLSQANMNLVE